MNLQRNVVVGFIGIAGLCLTSQSFADEMSMKASAGEPGISMSLMSPVYSTEYSDPTALPLEMRAEMNVSSSEESIWGSWEAGMGMPQSLLSGQPGLFEDALDTLSVR